MKIFETVQQGIDESEVTEESNKTSLDTEPVYHFQKVSLWVCYSYSTLLHSHTKEKLNGRNK